MDSYADPAPLRAGDPVPPAGRARLVVVEPTGAGLGADAVPAPTEDTLLVRVALPLASHRQRQAAAGFAVEDLIAEPLEASHVVLGPELGPGEYLVMVTRHTAMAKWASGTRGAHKRLVPDVLALPVPAPGSCSVREVHGRVLVRRADGTGFATRGATFEMFWRAEGAPQIVLFGGRLPDGVPVGATGLMPATATPEALGIDLLQGPYARGSDGPRRLLTRLAAVVLLALAAHGAVLVADTAALQDIARDREATLRGVLAERLPELPDAAPLDQALRRALPSAPERRTGGFLDILARASEALQPFGAEIAVRNLAFDAGDGKLAILLEASDLATLQQVEAGFGAAGLGVVSGVATTGNGAAEVRYVVGGPGG